MFEMPPGPPPPVDMGANRSAVISKPQKFMKAGCRKLCNESRNIGDLTSNSLHAYFTDCRGVVPKPSKQFMSMPNSVEAEWRQSRRLVEPPFHERARKEAQGGDVVRLSRLPVMPAVKRAQGKCHVQPPLSMPVDTSAIGIAAVYDTLTGERMNERKSSECVVELELQRKKRLETIEKRRNDIDMSSSGDKNYRHPETSEDFYRHRGLIPGSTFSFGYHPQTIPKGSTGMTSFAAEKPGALEKMTYKECETLRQLDEFKRAVQSLIPWEKSVAKEADPNYLDLDSEEETL
eukprot:GHVR01047687.1.p1 GENE.GHVR01047687.1~~GHVR01047687.1.p1  ORF type:complete len:290 (+),score=58.25 GHVR01047687.1:114-983(+)